MGFVSNNFQVLLAIVIALVMGFSAIQRKLYWFLPAWTIVLVIAYFKLKF